MADIAVPQRGAVRGGEHWIFVAGVIGAQLELAKEGQQLLRKRDAAHPCGRLRRTILVRTRPLPANEEDALVEVDVGPLQPEQFALAQPG